MSWEVQLIQILEVTHFSRHDDPAYHLADFAVLNSTNDSNLEPPEIYKLFVII